jgi:DTW domain-containing protein YfiP
LRDVHPIPMTVTMESPKITRQRKTKEPCPRCGLNPQLCICQSIPTLPLRTRVVLVIHAKELKRTTNTGALALEALPNSVMRVRGEGTDPLDLTDLLTADYQSLVFYPSADAVELSSDFIKKFEKPIQLFVPDGNWRQASKVHTRQKELSGLPRVMIQTPNLAQHHLRAESTSYGMSTLEAIAKALGVIEGPEVKASLTQLYQAKLQNTLKGRGIL